MTPLDYAEAETYLLGTIGESVSPRTSYKLDRIRDLLRRLGDPQRAYPSAHVGGTSGKGSTATMMAAALQAAGHRTGLHAKPHLRSMTERARVDGIAVSESRFADLLSEMLPAIEATVAAFGRPTYYETLLALAFLHFARERVDVAAIEVGLGGRLDGTNVIVPEVAAITSVGYDHTDVLGTTLTEIAREKAGIAKPGVPLVVAPVPDEARAAIEAVARDVGAPVIAVEEHARIEVVGSGADVQDLRVTTALARYRVRLPLLGTFQRLNVATAIVALEALPARIRPDPSAVERGLARVAIPGRMEIAPGDPPVVFDIAHNPEKMECLVTSLRERFPGAPLRFVVAIAEGKDARAVVATLQGAASIAFTRFETPGRHAIPPARLGLIARALGYSSREIDDPREALLVTRRGSAYDDVVVVTGSTFVVATLRDWWLAQRASLSVG